ncbi:hypothetical protein ALC62_07659 [Cyphomyrmex costatus]|uniref:Regulatory protein zeste n=1 Tax=Cyphomyrmex costatus TaxID=456900 RepID=A0A195CLY1_9HYME|nr:hypothetical protein ALC62_07659 [Cyphomyrmex costatus]
MIRRPRNENFSREEKAFVVRYVNENLKIFQNKSNTSVVFSRKRDKWQDLTEKLKAEFGVVRDWKEVRHAYQRWKWFAKKNVTAFEKWGDNLSANMAPTEFDQMILNIGSQNFEDYESNYSNESENNFVTNEYDELSNVSHAFDVNSESYNVPHSLQFTEKSTNYTNEILDNIKIKVEPHTEDLPKTYEETRINTCVQSTSVPVNSTNVANASEKSSFDVTELTEPLHKKRENFSSNDQTTNNIISNNTEFKRRENILKLKILRAQLIREEEENKIRMEQEKIKLLILKLQLKRERILLRNIQSS